jgi:hypothetical protein
MRKHLLAVACLASLGLASQARATTILQFSELNQTDVVTATTSGGVTTFTTNSATNPGFIPVAFSNLAGIGGPGGQANGFEQFVNVTSTSAPAHAGGQLTQTYSGTINFFLTAVGGGIGSQLLTVTFSVGNFMGAETGNSASLNASTPPDTVVFTSTNATMAAAIAGAVGRNFSLSFSNLSPSIPTSGGLVSPTTFNNAGTFSVTAIPEPASLISSSLALLAGLGCYRLRRKSA